MQAIRPCPAEHHNVMHNLRALRKVLNFKFFWMFSLSFGKHIIMRLMRKYLGDLGTLFNGLYVEKQ